MMDAKAPLTRLSGLNREGLGDAAVAAGEPSAKRSMRGNQLFHWMYHGQQISELEQIG